MQRPPEPLRFSPSACRDWRRGIRRCDTLATVTCSSVDSDSTDQAQRIRRIREERSVLDSVSEEAADLRRVLGADDRTKVSQYLEAVRDAERRIQTAESQNTQLPVIDRPAGTPSTFEEHAKLMYDLQVLAYQSDLTRVITFMMAREVSGRSYPEIEVGDPHHSLSHHRGDKAKIAKPQCELTAVNHRLALSGSAPVAVAPSQASPGCEPDLNSGKAA